MGSTASARPSPRLLLSLTTTVATALDTVVCTAATDLDTATESTTASVRLRLSPRLLLSPTTTAAMVDMVLATGATEDTEVTATAIPIGAKAPFSPQSSDQISYIVLCLFKLLLWLYAFSQ